jgi:hypothetical protein
VCCGVLAGRVQFDLDDRLLVYCQLVKISTYKLCRYSLINSCRREIAGLLSGLSRFLEVGGADGHSPSEVKDLVGHFPCASEQNFYSW